MHPLPSSEASETIQVMLKFQEFGSGPKEATRTDRQTDLFNLLGSGSVFCSECPPGHSRGCGAHAGHGLRALAAWLWDPVTGTSCTLWSSVYVGRGL